MKKYYSLIAVITLSLILSCCKSEGVIKTKESGAKLKDGTETYYIMHYNEMNSLKTEQEHYTADGKMLSHTKYEYTIDINGRVTACKEIDVMNGKYTKTQFDKFKNKLNYSCYNSDGTIYDYEEYDSQSRIKKKNKYFKGVLSSYLIYEYYDEKNIKSICEYSPLSKAIKHSLYYKDGKIAQEKEYDSKGMIKNVIKYKYEKDSLVAVCVYDSEFNLIQERDYSKTPQVKAN